MHKKFIDRAIELAKSKSADDQRGRFGAVIVKDNEIIGEEGWNRVVETRDPTAHAEVMAIREACTQLNTHDLSGCTIYASCEPCPMCLSAIYWAHIEKIVFACNKEDANQAGFNDSIIYSEISRDWKNRSISSEQMSRDEALSVFKKWMNNPNKMKY